MSRHNCEQNVFLNSYFDVPFFGDSNFSPPEKDYSDMKRCERDNVMLTNCCIKEAAIQEPTLTL